MHSVICWLCHNKRDLISFCTGESQNYQNYMKKMIEVVAGVKLTSTMFQYICVYCSVEVYNFYVFREKSLMRAEEIQKLIQEHNSLPDSENESLEEVHLPGIEELKVDFVPWLKSKLPAKENSTEDASTMMRENGPGPNPNNLRSDKSTQVLTIVTNDQQIQCNYPETVSKRVQCVAVSLKDKRIQCYPITDNKKTQCWLTKPNSDKQTECDTAMMEDKQTETPTMADQNIQSDGAVRKSTSSTQVDCDLVLLQNKQVECKPLTRDQSTHCNYMTGTTRHIQTEDEIVLTNTKCFSTMTENEQCYESTANKPIECDIPKGVFINKDKQVQCNGGIDLAYNKMNVASSKGICAEVNMAIGDPERDSIDMQKDFKNKFIKCSLCNLTFPRSGYYRHRMVHLQCCKCNLRFKSLKSYKHHLSTVCDDKMKSTAVVNITRLSLNSLKRASPESSALSKRHKTE